MNDGRDAAGSNLVVEASGMAVRPASGPLLEDQVETIARFSSTPSRYLIAILSVAAAIGASKACAIFLNIEPYVSLLLCSIMFTAWFGGFGPGLLAIALAVVAFDYYLLPRADSLIAGKDFARLGLFLVPSLFVAWLSAAQRRVTRSLQRSQIKLIAALEEQRQVEGRLRLSETYLAEAQRLSQTGSFGWKVATGELVWSAETFRIFGYDPSATPTLALVFERVHPDDRASVTERIDRASGDRRDFDYEFRLSLPDGSVKHVRALARAANDPSGEFEFIGAVMDRNASRCVEMELRESEQRFRDFAETASDWFWETDRDHRLTGLSRESTAVRGGIGAAPWEFAADREEEAEKWNDHLATLKARDPFRNFRFRTAQGDGAAVYLSVSGKPTFDSRGDFCGYRGVASDITASIRAEQAEAALNRAQRDLAHAARVIALGELTTSIAHEVNQPLAAVMSNAEAGLRWLDRGADHLGSVRRSVEAIVRDVNRAAKVIGRVRALARKTDTERTVFDINDVAVEVGGLLRRELAENRVLLNLDLSTDALMVEADRVQLQQVVMNLLMNGMEAMQYVTDRPRELLVRSRRNQAGDVHVVVEDCGVGFSTENADRLFDAFFTTKSRGLGLGLSICRTIIESHGGRLSASRRLETGSAFEFNLPFHQGA